MPTLTETIEGEWYPAWNSGDPERFEHAARSLFSPDVGYMLWEIAGSGLEDLLSTWLPEFEAWRPQQYEVLQRRADTGDAAGWVYRWTATHSGMLPLPDGSEVKPTGKSFEREGVVLARRGSDGRITSWHAFSEYPSVLADVTGRDPSTLQAVGCCCDVAPR